MKVEIRVLVACEFSGVVRTAFQKRGWEAWSCDLLPTEQAGNHIQGDVLDVLDDDWDLVIGHPPCTYLTLSGVHFLRTRPYRRNELIKGARFFREILNCKARHVAVENPIMCGQAQRLIGARPWQVVHPYHFGHYEQKGTCFWLRGLPPLRATRSVKRETLALPKSERMKNHYLSPTPDRGKKRSVTYAGIAEAMAEQWGGYVIRKMFERSGSRVRIGEPIRMRERIV